MVAAIPPAHQSHHRRVLGSSRLAKQRQQRASEALSTAHHLQLQTHLLSGSSWIETPHVRPCHRERSGLQRFEPVDRTVQGERASSGASAGERPAARPSTTPEALPHCMLGHPRRRQVWLTMTYNGGIRRYAHRSCSSSIGRTETALVSELERVGVCLKAEGPNLIHSTLTPTHHPNRKPRCSTGKIVARARNWPRLWRIANGGGGGIVGRGKDKQEATRRLGWRVFYI